MMSLLFREQLRTSCSNFFFELHVLPFADLDAENKFIISKTTIARAIVFFFFGFFLALPFFSEQVRVGGRNKNKIS